MFKNQLESFDPQNPAIFYYTNNSFKKPVSFSRQCKNRGRVVGYHFKSGTVLFILAIFYTGYLFYIAIEKPQFAINQSYEVTRKAQFGIQNLQVTGNAQSFWVDNKISITLSFKNLSSKQEKVLNIEYIKFKIGETLYHKKTYSELILKKVGMLTIFEEFIINKTNPDLNKPVVVNIKIKNYPEKELLLHL